MSHPGPDEVTIAGIKPRRPNTAQVIAVGSADRSVVGNENADALGLLEDVKLESWWKLQVSFEVWG